MPFRPMKGGPDEAFIFILIYMMNPVNFVLAIMIMHIPHKRMIYV